MEVMLLSDGILRMQDSATMSFAAKVIEKKQQGIDIINFTVGEPDFPTPENIKLAAIKAINENKTKYTLNTGIIELRQAFANYMKQQWNLEYNTDEIIVSTGAKQAVFNAVQAIVNEEDEVLIPLPAYPSHVEMVNFANGDPVLIETSEENSFKVTAKQIEENITPKTKALILCNPNNPTGAVYTKDELLKIAKVVTEHDLYVISDEVYEQLVYDDIPFTSFASLSEEIKNRSVIVNGVSKAYSMTGWRLGFSAAPKEISKGMAKLQSHSTSNPTTITQYAALEALTNGHEGVIEMVKEFSKRRDVIYEAITGINKLSTPKPNGAFYLFVNVKNYLTGDKITSSLDLANYLLDEARVAVVPGSGLGMEGYVRISYSTSMENILEGMDRLKNALSKIK